MGDGLFLQKERGLVLKGASPLKFYTKLKDMRIPMVICIAQYHAYYKYGEMYPPEKPFPLGTGWIHASELISMGYFRMATKFETELYYQGYTNMHRLINSKF